jgi:urocanate reductase
VGGSSIVPGFSANLSTEVKAGTVIQAQTIAALATAINVDPARLQATINTWNGYAQSGQDLDFGRTAGLGTIQTPPFYAIQTFSTMFDTNGGLKINANAQVIDTSENVIPRLYAAGTNSGGVIGEYYPGSGTSLNQGLTFGRIAGAYAAKQQAWT